MMRTRKIEDNDNDDNDNDDADDHRWWRHPSPQLHNNQPDNDKDEDKDEDKKNDEDEDENDNDCDYEVTIEWVTAWVIGRHNNQMKVGVCYWQQTLGNDEQRRQTLTKKHTTNNATINLTMTNNKGSEQ